MYVGLKMLKRGQFVTATLDTLVVDAEKMMLKNRLWMLLVVEGDKLLGYVSKEDVKAALPSPATTLSRHELNYVLSKLKLEKILRKDTPTIIPEVEIEEAAQRMDDEDVSGLAVVDRNNHLLGIINRSVMLEVLVEEMGLKQGGTRIVFEVEDRRGVIYEVSGLIADLGISIIATGTFFHNGKRMVVLRLATEDPAPVIKALASRDYHAVGPDHFAAEWR